MSDPTDDVELSRRATSFGTVAGKYAQLRPGWPPRTASWLVGEPSGPLRVLDLGAGTGKLTATLVDLGHDVVAVDPSSQMLDELRTAVPGVAAARLGSAEALPLEDDSVDAVTVAQAWHWFDARAAAAECARVLRPGGVLGIAWHIRDETVPWVARLAASVGRSGDSSSSRRGTPMDLGAAFGPAQEQQFAYEIVTTPEGLRDLADTWSYVYLAPDREQMLDAVLALGRSAAEPDGRLVVPHVTRCFRAYVK